VADLIYEVDVVVTRGVDLEMNTTWIGNGRISSLRYREKCGTMNFSRVSEVD